MGTNYYTRLNVCKCCNREEEKIHLGKSSCGWKFLFQYNNGSLYKNVQEMKRWLKNKIIEDEYGEIISHKDFWKMIEEKQKIIDPSVENVDYDIIGGYKFYNRIFS